VDELLLQQSSLSVEEAANTSARSQDDDWAACMGDVRDAEVTVSGSLSAATAAPSEVQQYLTEKNIKKESSPFTWWAGNKERFPMVALLARRYISAPMGSIASEREFKIAKRVVTGRWTMKPESVEMCLFLKYNLRMLGYKF
jgi:hypothetical protein